LESVQIEDENSIVENKVKLEKKEHGNMVGKGIENMIREEGVLGAISHWHEDGNLMKEFRNMFREVEKKIEVDE